MRLCNSLLLNMAIYIEMSDETRWFSRVMLVYQRVYTIVYVWIQYMKNWWLGAIYQILTGPNMSNTSHVRQFWKPTPSSWEMVATYHPQISFAVLLVSDSVFMVVLIWSGIFSASLSTTMRENYPLNLHWHAGQKEVSADIVVWLVVWNMFYFTYIGDNHLNWLSYFSEG